MELKTIKQFAEDQKVSYEAVRRQIVNYAESLEGHIIRKGRTQYLDEWAVAFLTTRRRENPIILMNMDQNEENQRLKEEIESLRVKLMTAQGELLRSQEERLKAQDRIIELQEETRKTLEERSRYTALLEESQTLSRLIEEKENQIGDIQVETDRLRQQVEDLTLERDAAQSEAQSFSRSFLGFYRKKKL